MTNYRVDSLNLIDVLISLYNILSKSLITKCLRFLKIIKGKFILTMFLILVWVGNFHQSKLGGRIIFKSEAFL